MSEGQRRSCKGQHRFGRRLRVLTGIVLVCIVSLVGLREWRLYIPQSSFDADVRKHADNVWTSPHTPTVRQEMIRDLTTNVLPGKTHAEIESLLGKSASHMEMRRYSDADFSQPTRRLPNGEYEPYPCTGDGWYFDEYDWDLIYPIGKELVFIYDHRGVFAAAMSPDDEYLLLRLDADGRYDSWFIYGSSRWPKIVGEPARRQFASSR